MSECDKKRAKSVVRMSRKRYNQCLRMEKRAALEENRKSLFNGPELCPGGKIMLNQYTK
jgi:hypothetical protein